MAYAWVQIVDKVFVDQDEIDGMVEHGYASILSADDTKVDSPEEAFKLLAQDKLSECFLTDTPFKYNEVKFNGGEIQF